MQSRKALRPIQVFGCPFWQSISFINHCWVYFHLNKTAPYLDHLKVNGFYRVLGIKDSNISDTKPAKRQESHLRDCPL